MIQNTRKKDNERFFLDAARQASPIIPHGEALDREEPDFRVQTAVGDLGIEIAEILASSPNGFVSRQVESWQTQVFGEAKRLYSNMPSEPANVLAYFSSAVTEERLDKAQLALSLAEFVRDRIPFVEAPTLLERCPKGISVVRLEKPTLGVAADWTWGGGGRTIPLAWDHVDREIKKKNLKLANYHRYSLGTWLLLVVDMFPVEATFEVPKEAAEWRFEFSFDKVLLFDRMYGRVFDFTRQ